MSEADSGAALLALSPDEVFASRSVAEVVELHKRIQHEIERKREELRAMVGERYRDLIHAADTIAEMRGSTAQSVEHIGGAVALCRNLHDTHLIGFRIPERTNYSDRPTAGAHSVAVQVKLLLDIPEQIWACVESEEYLTATQLFMLARHINTGLQLQTSSRSVQAACGRVRALVERQWSSVANLQQILEQAARDKLQEVDLTEETACSCLLSLHLLDGRGALAALLGELLALHSRRGLEAALRRDPPPAADADDIRARVVASVRVVLRTVELVQRCFVDKDGGTIVLRLRELFRQDAPLLLDLVLFQDEAALKLLPPVVTSYRLTSNNPMEPLSQQEVSEAVSGWLGWVEGFVRERVTLLLKDISSAKVLRHIREEALKIETPANWREMCASLSMSQPDVWARHYAPLLTARARELLAARWGSALAAWRTLLAADLRAPTETDINRFVWRDLIGDTVIESREQVVQTMNALMTGMWLQDRGFTPALERLCGAVEAELRKLLADLRHYLRDDGAAPADCDELLAYLREVSRRSIESMLQYIKEECLENPELQQSEAQRKATAVYAARFLQALPHLAPSVRACCAAGEDGDAGRGDGEASWREARALLGESCRRCWGEWVEIAMQKVEALTNGLPREFTLEANLDYLLMQWDIIKIEEKDEEGNPVESTIKIPVGPSLKLQEYLYAVGRILDEVVPHTLPKEVHVQFVEKIVGITLSHYGEVVREKETEINQKCALQLLMDVRHLTLLLVPREKKAATDASHEICESLRRIIDPFDYDVFYPYMQTNVKRSVQRVTTMLGSMAAAGAVAAAAAAAPAATAAERAPALLATPPDAAPWFSLLPITAPHPAHQLKKQDKMKRKAAASPARGAARSDLADLVAGSLPLNLASAKSGAAAFFGSMTSDWFGGS